MAGRRRAVQGHRIRSAAVNEPLVLLFNWESQKLEKQQIAEGITGGVIWRLRWLGDGSLMGVSGGSTGGFLLFWKPDAEKDFSPLPAAGTRPRHGPAPRRPAGRHGPLRQARPHHAPGGEAGVSILKPLPSRFAQSRWRRICKTLPSSGSSEF